MFDDEDDYSYGYNRHLEEIASCRQSLCHEDADKCICRGTGWWVSDFDTYEKCGAGHKGPHPESYEEPLTVTDGGHRTYDQGSGNPLDAFETERVCAVCGIRDITGDMDWSLPCAGPVPTPEPVENDGDDLPF